MSPESAASGGGPGLSERSLKAWPNKARRLSREHSGTEAWADNLKSKVADADEDDLGTFIVAIAAYSYPAYARQAEAARQSAARAAEEGRLRTTEEANVAQQRAAKQHARAIAKHKRSRAVSYLALPAGSTVVFFGLPFLGLSVSPADYVTDDDVSRLHMYLPIAVGAFALSLVMTIISARTKGKLYWPRVAAFMTFAIGLTASTIWLLIILGA